MQIKPNTYVINSTCICIAYRTVYSIFSVVVRLVQGHHLCVCALIESFDQSSNKTHRIASQIMCFHSHSPYLLYIYVSLWLGAGLHTRREIVIKITVISSDNNNNNNDYLADKLTDELFNNQWGIRHKHHICISHIYVYAVLVHIHCLAG